MREVMIMFLCFVFVAVSATAVATADYSACPARNTCTVAVLATATIDGESSVVRKRVVERATTIEGAVVKSVKRTVERVAARPLGRVVCLVGNVIKAKPIRSIIVNRPKILRRVLSCRRGCCE